eukprot:Clim_evm13s248 gene=Clim_evmTU13s248
MEDEEKFPARQPSPRLVVTKDSSEHADDGETSVKDSDFDIEEVIPHKKTLRKSPRERVRSRRITDEISTDEDEEDVDADGLESEGSNSSMEARKQAQAVAAATRSTVKQTPNIDDEGESELKEEEDDLKADPSTQHRKAALEASNSPLHIKNASNGKAASERRKVDSDSASRLSAGRSRAISSGILTQGSADAALSAGKKNLCGLNAPRSNAQQILMSGKDPRAKYDELVANTRSSANAASLRFDGRSGFPASDYGDSSRVPTSLVARKAPKGHETMPMPSDTFRDRIRDRVNRATSSDSDAVPLQKVESQSFFRSALAWLTGNKKEKPDRPKAAFTIGSDGENQAALTPETEALYMSLNSPMSEDATESEHVRKPAPFWRVTVLSFCVLIVALIYTYQRRVHYLSYVEDKVLKLAEPRVVIDDAGAMWQHWDLPCTAGRQNTESSAVAEDDDSASGKASQHNCVRMVVDGLFSNELLDQLKVLTDMFVTLGATNEAMLECAYLDIHRLGLVRGTDVIDIRRLEGAPQMKAEGREAIKFVAETVRDAVRQALYGLDSKASTDSDTDQQDLYFTSPTFVAHCSNHTLRFLAQEREESVLAKRLGKVSKKSKKGGTVRDKLLAAQLNYWHPHMSPMLWQSGTMMAILQLGDPSVEFSGGDIVLHDSAENEHILDARKGRLVVLSVGPENDWSVSHILTGTSNAVFFTFTHEAVYGIYSHLLYGEAPASQGNGFTQTTSSESGK